MKGIYDKNELVRFECQRCFELLLKLINSKETNEFNPEDMYKQAVFYIKQNNSNNSDLQHGALLLIIVLIQNCNKFMNMKFNEILQLFLNFKDTKNDLIKRTVISSLPYFAQLNPLAFSPKNDRWKELFAKEKNKHESDVSSEELNKMKCMEPLNTVMNLLISSLRSYPRRAAMER